MNRKETLMNITNTNKQNYISIIEDKLSQFSEVGKIILFGSFINSNNPNDIDIAIVQDSDDNFLTLSLKYRKVLRDLAKIIPLDIIPIKSNVDGSFLEEINKGKIIYEK